VTADCGVLVVEDDADIRDVIAALLQELGYTVVLARNGREALQRLRSGTCRPCLILLDLWMPVMDAWEFRKEQQTDPSLAEIPVVALSGTGEESFDAAAHLIKPVQFEPLISTVERFCGPGIRRESPPVETDQPRLAAIRHARGELLTWIKQPDDADRDGDGDGDGNGGGEER
jgi:two-component system, chemotaxis family, chemotaxis protein CheY